MADLEHMPEDELTADIEKVTAVAGAVVMAPHPQLFPHRPGRRRTARDHDLADLVVHHLGRRLRHAAHPAGLSPETYLPWPIPGHRPGHRLRRADAARLPHRQPRRPHPGRVRREPAQPHADRAADLQDHEADLRDAVLEVRLELPQGGAGRISGAGHVVAGVHLAAAEQRRRRRKLPGATATTSRCFCRARRTRPPASSSTCSARS